MTTRNGNHARPHSVTGRRRLPAFTQRHEEDKSV
jgi:hypothetical protein